MHRVPLTVIQFLGFFSGFLPLYSCSEGSQGSDVQARERSRAVELVDFEPSLPAQTVSGTGAFAAVSLDVMTGTTYMQTGKTIQDAISLSLTTCRLYSSEMDGQCTTSKVYSTRLSPTLSGDLPNSWDCFSRENPITGDISSPRYWLDTGNSVEVAKEAALKICQLEGGVGCSIDRCYNGGRDKIR